MNQLIPKTYRVTLILMDTPDLAIVELTQLAYNQADAEAAIIKLVDRFNYKHSCHYQVDSLWEVHKRVDLLQKGQPVNASEVDLTKAGEKQRWNRMKEEFDFIQLHYVNQWNVEG
jgi:hypothetical protein